MTKFDYLLVGGGLQNGLLALALQHFQPHSRVLLLEAASRYGGNHTWSFHASDLPQELQQVVGPLVERTWPAHDVVFPGYTRRIESGYSAIPSHRLHDALLALSRSNSNFEMRLNCRVASATATHVVSDTGDSFEASLVVDSRGPEGFVATSPTGYQKFVGIEVEVASHDTPSVPTLIDANVEQTDGFRFFYVLPLRARRVLIEDTYFSESPELDRHAVEARIREYASAHRLQVTERIRTETGVLPLPRRGLPSRPASNSPLLGGYRGGWFHPTTGYSFPPAARLSLEIARTSLDCLDSRLRLLRSNHERQVRFCMLLNRLLFDGFEPEDRRSVFERFYRLPQDTIHRFYALGLTRPDQLRILCGRPPKGFRTSRLLDRIKMNNVETAGGLQ